jgi:hypothetical protein
MQTSEAKAVIVKHLNKLITEWFDDKPLIQAVAKTALQANINKYDNLLEMLTDEKGNLLVDELIDNLGIKNGYEIDLTTISPLLPNRIVIISKEDIESLIRDLNIK